MIFAGMGNHRSSYNYAKLTCLDLIPELKSACWGGSLRFASSNNANNFTRLELVINSSAFVHQFNLSGKKHF